jgi:hypothetical protein
MLYLKKNRGLVVLAALAALLIVASCDRVTLGRGSRSHSGATITCPIDGLPATKDAIHRRPLAVLIENSPQARPQSGLDQACVVYEGITEGGITRFLAIYLHNTPETVGPVRSVRPHFIYLAQEYDPVLVHCGQSYEALQILTTAPPVFDLDQLKHDAPFWRDRSRRAPHNLYASAEEVRAYMQQQQWDGTVQRMQQFTGSGKLLNADPATEAKISFGGAVKYSLKLVYDSKAGGYLRYMDGKLHVDRVTKRPLVAKNVIVQYVWNEEFANSTHGTQDVRVVGSGAGWLMTGGQRTKVRWNKLDYGAITKFTDDYGAPLPLRDGQTWVELVPADGNVIFAQPVADRAR